MATPHRDPLDPLDALRRPQHHAGGVRVSARTFYLLSYGMSLGIGIACLVSAILFFALPDAADQSSINAQLGPLDDLWSLGFGLGGLLIVTGLLRRSPTIDVAGLVVLTMAILVNVVAIVATLGARSLTTVPTLLALAFGAVARVLIVARVVYVEDDPE